MVHFSVQASLALLASTASGLIIDVIQLPQIANTPVLRLCRPLLGQQVVAANPLRGNGCPSGASPFWLWDYNSTPNIRNALGKVETLINLKGLDTGSGEDTYMLNELGYDTKFLYGTTQFGLRVQPSQFRIKRNGVYQQIDVNNKLAVDDLLEFFGPPSPAVMDATIRLQSQSRNPAYPAPLIRQLGTATSAISTAQYPIITLRIASLTNQEIIVPAQSWLQRGTNFLSQAANAVRSGYDTVVSAATPYLKNLGNSVYGAAGNLIDKGINAVAYRIGSLADATDKKLAQWTDRAGDYVTNLGTRLVDSAGNYLNNLGTRIADSTLVSNAVGLADAAANRLSQAYDNTVGGLVAAGGYIDNRATRAYDKLGNVLNNAVDYVAAPLATAGQWVGDTAAAVPGRLVGGYNGVINQLGNAWQGVKDLTAAGLTNLAGGISPGVVVPGAVGAVQQEVVADAAGDVEMIPLNGGVPVVEDQVSVPVLPRGLNGDLPVINEVVSDIGDDESWTDLSASQFFRFKRS
ncbi:hypothetical protein TWF694_009603 [Orbilia ellipsospora]|uniref:Uncharacterized protein n=1 Tax=Orbilia ellipsospora TaxID=2528407 RepID=A0AAV9XED4_9PEZI